MVGTLHTENLGIERLIKNTLATPTSAFSSSAAKIRAKPLVTSQGSPSRASLHMASTSAGGFTGHGASDRC